MGRRRFIAGLAALASAVWVVLAIACGSTDSASGSDCHAGDQISCSCADGSKGLSACEDGNFGQCACTPTDAGGGDGEHEGGPSTSDAGFGEYMGKCNATSDCPEGGVCFSFMTKGMYCTKNCTSDADCPAPSPKCNPKGVCAVPD